MAGTTDISPPVVPDVPDQTPPQQPAPQPQPSLKDEDKQRLVQIIVKMQKAGEPDDNIRAVVKRFQEINGAPPPSTTPVDKGIRQTDKSLNQPLQFNGTFQPDLEGEKKGLYVNDPEYQKQKNDFVQRIATDPKGNLLYPEQDAKTGQWSNYYTKQPLPNFDPQQIKGAILQVPHEYLPATGGKQFITPQYDPSSNAYKFPGVETPSVPTEQDLPQATVYGKKAGVQTADNFSGAARAMVNESKKQGGQLGDVLNNHPELAGQIDETIKKYGPEYSQSLATGSGAMSNILQKTVEDHYDLNKPLPNNVDPKILDGHLNVVNNFEKNRQAFELNQRELQRQADLLTDRSKRTGQAVSPEDADRLAQKASQNIQQWNTYAKSVQFSQNFLNQPEVKNYLDEFKKRQTGLQLIDEVNQRAFPNDNDAKMSQDSYDRKAIEGNLNLWDYLKTAGGQAGKALSNIGETAGKVLPGVLVPGLTPSAGWDNSIEKLNNNAQKYLTANLPSISPEGIDQMNKLGMGHVINDVSGMVGGMAPYIVPGLAGEGLGGKAATFATSLAEGIPQAKEEALKQGLTGSAYNTFIAAKPLVTAAFMTMLPNAKFAKGFDRDVAKAVVNGEFNASPLKAMLNLAKKVVTVHPGDVAHMQAMLSGTALGEALVNKITNGLQATQDLSRGISGKEGLPTELSGVFNPRQTAVMALSGKLLEAIPTMKNAMSELHTGKEIQGTYDNIQNNLVELAGHNLEGASNAVNALVKKDPGNIYAQHLKTTLEDFAHAEARMPQGLEPEQKAALFDVQKKIMEKQRQMATADPVYQPHLQKNIDELNKQIPEILKDPKKANDYLASGHREFAREIMNPPDADGSDLEGNRKKDLADLKERESGLNPKMPGFAEEKANIEKERDEINAYYDKRISSPKTETDGKNENAPAQTEGKGEIEKPAEGAEPAAGESTAPSIEQNPAYRTLDYGENKGKPEGKLARQMIKQEILEDVPVGKTGEKFSDFLRRVIPAFQKSLKEDQHNTAVVTHSSVIKALQVWEEMGRPDISEIKGDKLKDFAKKYVDIEPEAEGKVHTFTSDNGNDIKVVRHGETEDNKLSEFREDDTKLTDKGESQAARAGDNLIKETGGDIPKLISSDLPRTLHTSQIINDKLQNHAVQEKRSVPLVENGTSEGKQNDVQKGESEKSGVDRKAKANVEDKVSDRRTEAARAWLQAIERNDTKASGNAEKELLREPDDKEGGQKGGRSVLDNNDGNGSEIRASGDNGEKTGSKTPEKGTRTSQGQKRTEQRSGQSGTSDAIGTHETSSEGKDAGAKGQIQQISDTERGEVVRKVRQLSELPYGDERTRISRDLQQMLSEGLSNPGKAEEISRIIQEHVKKSNELPFIDEKADDEFTSTKNAITKKKIEEYGLKPAMAEAAREFGTVWKDAQEKLAKGFDIEKLIKSLDQRPRAVTDIENAMILFHQNVKESQLAEANKDIAEATDKKNTEDLSDAIDRRAKLLDDLQSIYNVDKKIGRETARGLNARKMMADRRFSLVNMQLEKRASTGGEPLSDKQMEEVKKQYEEIKAAKDALDTRVAELEKENARLTAEKTISEQSKVTTRTRKSKEQFKTERQDIVSRMRQDLLKAAKGGGGLTSSIPFAEQLKTIAPHMAQLVKSFIEQGIDKIEDITREIHALLKPEIPDLEERHVHDLIAGVYGGKATEKPDSELTSDELAKRKARKEASEKYANVKQAAQVQKYRATDSKTMKLQADYERAKEKYEQSLKVDERKSRSALQKVQDGFLKYERAAKLSNPITLGKLVMAALTRLATTPIEEAVGGVYSAGLPGIAKKAPGEAGVHVSALARGYKQAFMKGLDDAATVAKGGKSDIQAVFGKKEAVSPEAMDFFGQLHSAIKAPVKRFAFERSFQKRIANNIKNGVTIDGLTEARIAVEAYKDAERSIFMQDNLVAKGWRGAMNALEKHGEGGKLAATIGQWLVPFVKVPSNIIAETISHVAGPEIAITQILAKSLGKGLKTLSQDEAESIMRNFKKGTIGHVALMAGYLNPQAFGGYYQKGEKRDEGDVKPGDLKINGVNIPAWALEAPVLQAMQIGATVRRIKDTMVKGEAKGIGEGIMGGAMGLLSHEPLLDEPSRLAGALTTDKERGYFFGELAKSTLVPAIVEYVAKVSDPADTRSVGEKALEPENKRSPESIKEHVESAVPGLREEVPTKQPKGGHRQSQRHR